MTNPESQQKLAYQLPDERFVSLVDAPPAPGLSINRQVTWMVLAQTPSLPSIEELAQPELRLAGLRISPLTNGPSRGTHIINLTLQEVASDHSFEVNGLPVSPRINFLTWAPNGKFVAFGHTTLNGIEAWVLDVATKTASRVGAFFLNAAMSGNPITWMPDSSGLIVRAIPERGPAPVKPLVPEGPVITESNGEVAAVRTYQDLLQDRYDEEVFEYYSTSEILRVSLKGTSERIGEKNLYFGNSVSPDGKYLVASRLAQPFSYLVTYQKFPREIECWTIDGKKVRTLASVPSGETIPKGFMATRTGPREFQWRADADASIYWFETQDGGDPAVEVEIRDKLFHLEAPFDGDPIFDMDVELRAADITWGTGDLALIEEYWWSNRRLLSSFFSPDSPTKNRDRKPVFDRSWEDRYNDPGHFETVSNERGRSILLIDSIRESLYLTGQGASPEGNLPFLDRFSLQDHTTTRLWRAARPNYEMVLHILDTAQPSILTRREGKHEPPNYYILDLESGKRKALTAFPHPYPHLKTVDKEIVKYKRADGVALTAKLYLPPGYSPENDGQIPVLLWAYPEEYKSSDAAGQVSGSPDHFIRIGWYSPLFWLMRGYAILDDPAMPIVGEGEEEPNDTFIEQLVSNAKAAIDYLVDRKIADPSKIAVGGHSYGAFMTANLLAHSDLFACGIARSGAYNRTLTPFGFQAEERTLWEAKETYINMSPFSYADKIDDPILLIHGAADNNSGTYPMQSERFFNALKGHGAVARLVLLPHESHSYAARESILHMVWEMDRFLQLYLE